MKKKRAAFSMPSFQGRPEKEKREIPHKGRQEEVKFRGKKGNLLCPCRTGGGKKDV